VGATPSLVSSARSALATMARTTSFTVAACSRPTAFRSASGNDAAARSRWLLTVRFRALCAAGRAWPRALAISAIAFATRAGRASAWMVARPRPAATPTVSTTAAHGDPPALAAEPLPGVGDRAPAPLPSSTSKVSAADTPSTRAWWTL
jgi:hypothetical protein